MSFEAGLDFVDQYPSQGYVSKDSIRMSNLEYYYVLYSRAYREILELYTESDRQKDLIRTHIMQKLEGKVLVDLGCGQYHCNVSALAYHSNASRYFGIDVNVEITEYENEVVEKEFLKNQYKLSAEVEAYTTRIRTVFDDFRMFLRKAPDQAGYNFSMNGLELISSSPTIREHLPRLMNPGNIIIASDSSNIHIPDILTTPHNHIQFPKIGGSRSLDIYEKLDPAGCSNSDIIQQSIRIQLHDMFDTVRPSRK